MSILFLFNCTGKKVLDNAIEQTSNIVEKAKEDLEESLESAVRKNEKASPKLTNKEKEEFLNSIKENISYSEFNKLGLDDSYFKKYYLKIKPLEKEKQEYFDKIIRYGLKLPYLMSGFTIKKQEAKQYSKMLKQLFSLKRDIELAEYLDTPLKNIDGLTLDREDFDLLDENKSINSLISEISFSNTNVIEKLKKVASFNHHNPISNLCYQTDELFKLVHLYFSEENIDSYLLKNIKLISHIPLAQEVALKLREKYPDKADILSRFIIE